jgi:hypothetical protein
MIVPFVEPLLQRYAAAPVTVIVADPPEQIEGELTVKIGLGKTLTDEIAVFEHVPIFPITE